MKVLTEGNKYSLGDFLLVRVYCPLGVVLGLFAIGHSIYSYFESIEKEKNRLLTHSYQALISDSHSKKEEALNQLLKHFLDNEIDVNQRTK